MTMTCITKFRDLERKVYTVFTNSLNLIKELCIIFVSTDVPVISYLGFTCIYIYITISLCFLNEFRCDVI